MEIRPYRGADESELLDVWRASMTADGLSDHLFRTKVLLDPNFMTENLLVAVEGERLAGFVLALTRQVPLFLQGLESDKAWITAFGVHPDYQRRGIGSALFNTIRAKLAAEGRRTIDISPYVPNYFVPGVDIHAYPATLAFLDKVGFRVLYNAISMGADLSGFRIPPEILELERRREQEDGLTIRPVAAADLPELMPFIVRHFGWDWYRHAQDYLLELFGGSNTQHICFLVARQHGEIVGYCQQRLERFGPFGVDPSRRNLGIGRLLLFRCLATMSARHTYFAYFLWTGEDAARLYSLAGFKRRREFAVLHTDL
jgi:ribosomal protein S18 acetylase RimI-like enzyme